MASIKHGLSKHPLYRVWNTIKARCRYESVDRYKNYGGRGIVVCKEWLEDFVNFYNWAINNGWKIGLTIERENVNGNYEPNNCKWIPLKDQAFNKTNSHIVTAFNESKNLHNWPKDKRCVVSKDTLRYRLKSGWLPEEALITPANLNNKILNMNKRK